MAVPDLNSEAAAMLSSLQAKNSMIAAEVSQAMAKTTSTTSSSPSPVKTTTVTSATSTSTSSTKAIATAKTTSQTSSTSVVTSTSVSTTTSSKLTSSSSSSMVKVVTTAKTTTVSPIVDVPQSTFSVAKTTATTSSLASAAAASGATTNTSSHGTTIGVVVGIILGLLLCLGIVIGIRRKRKAAKMEKYLREASQPDLSWEGGFKPIADDKVDEKTAPDDMGEAPGPESFGWRSAPPSPGLAYPGLAPMHSPFMNSMLPLSPASPQHLQPPLASPIAPNRNVVPPPAPLALPTRYQDGPRASPSGSSVDNPFVNAYEAHTPYQAELVNVPLNDLSAPTALPNHMSNNQFINADLSHETLLGSDERPVSMSRFPEPPELVRQGSVASSAFVARPFSAQFVVDDEDDTESQHVIRKHAHDALSVPGSPMFPTTPKTSESIPGSPLPTGDSTMPTPQSFASQMANPPDSPISHADVIRAITPVTPGVAQQKQGYRDSVDSIDSAVSYVRTATPSLPAPFSGDRRATEDWGFLDQMLGHP